MPLGPMNGSVAGMAGLRPAMTLFPGPTNIAGRILESIRTAGKRAGAQCAPMRENPQVFSHSFARVMPLGRCNPSFDAPTTRPPRYGGEGTLLPKWQVVDPRVAEQLRASLREQRARRLARA